MEYVQFLRKNARFIGFGFLMCCGAGFGATYFIALFNTEIRAAFDLSNGAYGALYGMATIASTVPLAWVGAKIDVVDLRLYSAITIIALAVCCALMGVAGSIVLLFVVLAALRLLGQGLMNHVAWTSMARYYDRDRGKATSLVTLGFAAGEMVFPLTCVTLIALIGWRQTWLVAAVFLAVVMMPLVLWLLRGQGERHRQYCARVAQATAREQTNPSPAPRGSQWRLLGERRLAMILPAVIAPNVIVGGLFFFQVQIAADKGWTMTWFASCIVAFAVTKVIALLFAGPLVDRFGAARLLFWVLWPQGLALIGLVVINHPIMALLAMAGTGLSTGANKTVTNAIWGELYSPSQLGTVRSLVSALSVLATAVAPFGMGVLLDLHVSIGVNLLLLFAYVVITTAMTVGVSFSRPPHLPAGTPAQA